MKSDHTESILTKYCVGPVPAAVSASQRLEWKIEAAKPGDLVVYNLAEGAEPLRQLTERLKSAAGLALLLSRAPSGELSVPFAVVRDGAWVECVRALCDEFLPLRRDLPILAVTGTNGKTTTADLVLQLGEAAGLRGLSIGTLGLRQHGRVLEDFGATTPGQVQLRQLLAAHAPNLDFVIMEVSSHALYQGRVAGLEFAAAAWTSFTQDHLDYHRSMDEYFAAKERIVQHLGPSAKLFVPRTQTALAQKLAHHACLAVTPEIPGETIPQLPPFFRASFNRDNLACALALVARLGVTPTAAQLRDLRSPPGRFYVREWDNRAAVVDFAHTPDALENILRGVRSSYPRHRLVVLFGCGGDRDRSKRPLMGQVAAQLADRIILTSDNPRSEDPSQILEDIRQGVGSRAEVQVIVDRPSAVRTALARLGAGEVLLLAGKGHEDYILIGKTKHPYSDIDELEKFYQARRTTP